MNHNQTLEHFEICDGTEFEKRGLKDSDVMGRVIFWRMKQKMTQKTTSVAYRSEVHLPDAPCRGPDNYYSCKLCCRS